jgi:predicted aspartyl protease
MLNLIRHLALLSFVALAASAASPTTARALDNTPEEAVAAAETEAAVATSLSETERMLVPVTIAGNGPHHFIVDTAAERSVISRELAAELGLERAGEARLLSMTASRERAMVQVPQLSFMPGQQRSLVAFALEGENLGAAGILGIDALRGQRVVLDFDQGQMRVGPAPRRAERLGPNDIVVRGRPRYGQLVLADSTADGREVDVIVDSGLQVSVGNDALRALLVSRRNEFQRIALLSITGETFDVDYTRVDNLRIGDFAITGLPVAFGEPYFFRRMGMNRRPALLLGMDALQMFSQVAVDFPNRRAHFVLRDEDVAPGAGG